MCVYMSKYVCLSTIEPRGGWISTFFGAASFPGAGHDLGRERERDCDRVNFGACAYVFAYMCMCICVCMLNVCASAF